jgi:hypothetical protein
LDIFDIIEKWDMTNQNLDFRKMTRTNIKKLAEEIENVYTTYKMPIENGLHLPVSTAVEIMESKENTLPETAYPLLLSNQLWLPDPLYSLLSPKATSLWQKIPEGGAKNYSSSPMVLCGWKNYWLTRITERGSFLNQVVPNLVKKLMGLKELVKNKNIYLYPWECFLYDNFDNILTSVKKFNEIKEIEKSVTQYYTQKNYSLGVRLGAMDIHVAEDCVNQGLKKGDPMWFGDKTEVYFVGVVNTLVTSLLKSNMYAKLPGDRLIHDYIRSGGIISPNQNFFKIEKEIPDLRTAVWEDIVAIKKDSELLNKMKDLIIKFSFGDDEHYNQNVKDELLETAREISNTKGLVKYFKGPLIELAIGTLSGSIASIASGIDTSLAIKTTAVITGSTFLYSLVSDFLKKENIEKRKRKDVILKIANKI